MVADRVIGSKSIRFVVHFVTQEAKELLLFVVAVANAAPAYTLSYAPELTKLGEKLDTCHKAVFPIISIFDSIDVVIIVEAPTVARPSIPSVL